MSNINFDKRVRFWWSRNGVVFGKLIRGLFFVLAMATFLEYSAFGTRKFTLYEFGYFLVWYKVIGNFLR